MKHIWVPLLALLLIILGMSALVVFTTTPAPHIPLNKSQLSTSNQSFTVIDASDIIYNGHVNRDLLVIKDEKRNVICYITNSYSGISTFCFKE